MSFTRWLEQCQWTNITTRRDRHWRKARQHHTLSRLWLETLEWRLAPAITLSISNPAPFPEGDSGTHLGMFVVTRSGDLGPAAQVDFITQDGTAHAGTDYTATSGTLTFAPNQTMATIGVPIIGNTLFQPNRTFTVALSNPRVIASFAAQQSFAAGSLPRSVAVADFNGDGTPDIVTANNFSDTVSVLLNTTAPGATTPSFAPQQSFATGTGAFFVAVGDFNGDGRPDLVVANSNDNTVSVLLSTTPAGATTPSFAPQQAFATGAGPSSVVVADFNGDGKPDVAVANVNSSTVSVLLNTTAPGASVPSFAAQQSFPTGNVPSGVAAADVNADGRADLVVTNSSDNTVSVLLNTTAPGATTPSFAAQQTFATGTAPSSVAVGDFNGDGRPDLAVANGDSATVSVLLNATAPGATTPSFAAQQTFATHALPTSVAVGDFNGDGKVDLGVANSSDGTVSVLVNSTAAGASVPSFFAQQAFASGSEPFAVAVNDFNGDGLPDLVVANAISSGTVSVLLNTRVPVTISPSFPFQQVATSGTEPFSSVAVADFNGDGKPDLAIANDYNSHAGTPSVSVLLNTTAPGASTPSFAAPQAFPSGAGNARFVAVGDFNGDGKPDLVVINDLDATVSVLLNTTAPGASVPSFAAFQSFATGNTPRSVAVADLNGDGKPDLAVANYNASSVSVLLNTTAPGAGTVSFSAQQAFGTGSGPRSVAVADLNGDGRPDLVVANAAGNSVSVLLNTTAPGASTPSFATQHAFATGNGPRSVAVADLNGDGKPDLAVANYFSNTASVLLNTTAPGASGPSFAAQQTFATGYHPVSVAVADVNGDGKPDLAAVNLSYTTQGLSVLLNTTPAGATLPSFASQLTFQSFLSPRFMTVGDFNGDGKPDVVVASGATAGGSNAVSVYLNTQAPAITLSGSPATGTIQDDDAPASITIVAGNNQSATVNTAFATNLAVDIRNAAGSLVRDVTVTFTAPTSGPSGTFNHKSSVMVSTNASGRATAPTFTANGVTGSYTVLAQASGGSSPSASFSLTNTSGVTNVTHFSVSAPSTSTAGSPFDVTVSALDASNHVVTNYNGTIHFTTSDGNHVLPADYTFVAGDNGIHTFASGVTLRTAGSQTVSVNDTVNTSVTGSATVSVSPAAPDHLLFGQQPTNTGVGATITPAVTVQIVDAFNNLVTSDNTDQVTITIGTNPSGGTISGTTIVMVNAGLATFSNLSINRAGNGYALAASSGGLTGATSTSFNITTTTTTVEDFESGNLSAYQVANGTTATATVQAAAAHDGAFGLQDSNGNDWIFRNDGSAHVQQGDRISVWLQLNTATNGQAYFGFGASSTGTLSIVAAPSAKAFQLQSNIGYNTNTVLGTVTQVYQPNHWYRLEVNWGSTGNITGKLFDSDGTTLLNTVTGSNTTITSGGIAFRANGNNVKYWDTVQRTPGVNVAGPASDVIQLGSSLNSSDGSNASYGLRLPLERKPIETRLLPPSAVVHNQPIDLARVLLSRREANRFEARDALFASKDLAGLADADTALTQTARQL
jgi:hypothetical protein